jgi:hypothetical protein
VQFFPDVGPDPRAGGKGAKGLVALEVEPGRVAEPGPFAERVAAQVAPAAPRLPAVVHKNRGGTMQMVDVHLEEPLVPRRLDTRVVQQALAAAGFRWLIVHLYVEERSQVLPAARQRLGSALATTGCRVSGGLPPEGRRSSSRCAPSPRPMAGLEPVERVITSTSKLPMCCLGRYLTGSWNP